MEKDHITLVPVDSDENVEVLREYRKLLETTRGPGGSVKLFVTGGGYHQLTASGSALLRRLELENPILQCIAQVAGDLADHGLYLGVVVSRLLELHSGSGSPIGKQKMLPIINTLTQALQEMMKSELVCAKVDFNSINSFLPLVRTVVTSKPNTLFSSLDVDNVCFQIVKVFLNCIDERTGSVGRVYVRVDEGGNEIFCYNGLVYQITNYDDLKIIKQIVGEVKILVFTLKLDDLSINYVMSILEKAIESGVKIVACQKTVTPEIKLYLRRKSILLLHRMGTDLTLMLVQISQAFPISHLQINVLEVPKFVGYLSTVKHIQFNETDYILLQNNNATVGTILLQTRSLAGPDHIKALVNQAINALRSLAMHPALTFGGGCLEVWLAAQIELLKQSRPLDRDLGQVAQWVQQALLSTSTAEATDSVYHHGWHWQEGRETSCCCGHVTQDQLVAMNGQLVAISEVIQAQVQLNPPYPSSCSLDTRTLVDCHQQKLNVILSALETFTNLSDVGLILH